MCFPSEVVPTLWKSNYDFADKDGLLDLRLHQTLGGARAAGLAGFVIGQVFIETQVFGHTGRRTSRSGSSSSS